MADTPPTVVDEILARRIYGHTTCAVIDRDVATTDESPAGAVLDVFVARFGFTGIGNSWAEVTLADAKVIAREVLHKDLAYRMDILPPSEAAALAERFFSLFEPTARCFTNGNVILPAAASREVPGAYDPITPSTFDTGVVCFDRQRIGILWVQDED
jgi:hypothetical protein